MTPRYTPAFQRSVLADYARTGSGRRTAAKYEVHYQTVYRWAGEARRRAKPLQWRCCNRKRPATDPCETCGAPAPLDPTET